MNLEQALSNLYQAASMAKLTAQEHEVIKQSAQVIAEAIKPSPIEEAKE